MRMAGRKGAKLKSNIDTQFFFLFKYFFYFFLKSPHTSDNAYGNISIERTDPYICFLSLKMFYLKKILILTNEAKDLLVKSLC